MTHRPVSRALRAAVRERADGVCEYCRAPEWIIGQSFEVDHIVPRAKDGTDDLANLCWACPGCNASKQARTHHQDPIDAATVRLFDPRRDVWWEHFRWEDSGTEVAGIPAIGRATVDALRLNNNLITSARSLWRAIGWQPDP